MCGESVAGQSAQVDQPFQRGKSSEGIGGRYDGYDPRTERNGYSRMGDVGAGELRDLGERREASRIFLLSVPRNELQWSGRVRFPFGGCFSSRGPSRPIDLSETSCWIAVDQT